MEKEVFSQGVCTIMIEHLRLNGFDGLCTEKSSFNGKKCSCTVDNLFPCGANVIHCHPYKNSKEKI